MCHTGGVNRTTCHSWEDCNAMDCKHSRKIRHSKVTVVDRKSGALLLCHEMRQVVNVITHALYHW